MYMPFGVSGFTPPYGPVKYNIDFALKEGEYIDKFREFIESIESKVIEYVLTIFGSEISRDAFNSNIKPGSGTYEPKFRVKVDDTTRFFDVGDADITTDLEDGLYRRHSGAAIVELSNVYFMNKRFGLVWKMVQMKIYEPQRLHGYTFEDDDEVDKPLTGFNFA
jgi:Family of unknown function (DUF5871)